MSKPTVTDFLNKHSNNKIVSRKKIKLILQGLFSYTREVVEKNEDFRWRYFGSFQFNPKARFMRLKMLKNLHEKGKLTDIQYKEMVDKISYDLKQ